MAVYPQCITDQSILYVTAGFPTYPSGSPHGGIDYVTPDHNFYSPVAGTVVFAQTAENPTYDWSYGNMIIIQIGSNEYVLLAHFASQIWSVGQTVERGQFIGVQGETGNVTGIHTHMEYLVGGMSANWDNRRDPSVLTGIPNAVGTYDVSWDAENPPGPPGPPGPGPSRKALPLMYYVRHPIFRI